MARYNADGSLDAGFDGDGLVTTSAFPTGPERARDVAIQSDGKIVAVGFGTTEYVAATVLVASGV